MSECLRPMCPRLLVGPSQKGVFMDALILSRKCDCCDSVIALMADELSGVVVGVCGACGMGWLAGSDGSPEDAVEPAEWFPRFVGPLTLAGEEQALRAGFSRDAFGPDVDQWWHWDSGELSRWAAEIKDQVAAREKRRRGEWSSE